MYLNDIATIPANMAGLPAISVPCGESNGLPIGLQLVGDVFDEVTIHVLLTRLSSLVTPNNTLFAFDIIENKLYYVVNMTAIQKLVC